MLLTILYMNQPAESTNTGLVMPYCSRRCQYKISRLLKILISVRYRDLFVYLSEHDDTDSKMLADSNQDIFAVLQSIAKKFHSRNPQEDLTL